MESEKKVDKYGLSLAEKLEQTAEKIKSGQIKIDEFTLMYAQKIESLLSQFDRGTKED